MYRYTGINVLGGISRGLIAFREVLYKRLRTKMYSPRALIAALGRVPEGAGYTFPMLDVN